MLELIRIQDKEDKNYKSLISLYQEAFPESERRDIDQLERLISDNSEMYFNAIICDNELSGFFIFWDFKDFYFLEHLAVYEKMRNKKIGQQVLGHIEENLKGLRILEVEPPTDEISTRRVNYYKRNGYIVLDENYMQPSYREDEDVANLWIMSNYKTDKLHEYLVIVKEKAYWNPIKCRF